jgi:elongation factor 1 alpha-like protein
MTWLNAPPERQTIFLQPLYPRGGLLGGSPDAAPKMSKLQALAAARKKKAQEEKSKGAAEAVNKPMANLAITSPTEKGPAGSATKENSRAYLARKRKSSSPHKRVPQPVESAQHKPSEIVEDPISPQYVEVARPSAFASAMFGHSHSTSSHPPPSAVFTLPYLAIPSAHSTDAFAGPSPDDVVLAAQSKGSAHSANPRR